MDAYVVVFSALVLGAMAVSVLLGLRDEVGASCGTAACHQARGLLPWLGGLATVTAVLAIARVIGPVFSTPAEVRWMLVTPIDRLSMLRPRLVRVAAIALGVALVLGFGLAALGGFGVGGGAVFMAICAFGAALLALLAAIAQGRHPVWVRGLTWVLTGLVWVGLLLVALDRVPRLAAPTTAWPWWLALAVLVVVTAWAWVRAASAVRRTTRRSLEAGGRMVPGMSGAMATLDFALLYDVLIARRWRDVEGVRPHRARTRGWWVLVERELLRLARAPQTVVLVLATIVVPYAAVEAGMGAPVVLPTALVAFVASLAGMSSLRVFTRSASLSRTLPFTDQAQRAATLIIPGLLLVVMGLASAPAFARAANLPALTAVEVGVAVGLSALASATRWVTGRPPDYSRPLVTSPAGAVPTNLYGSALRGFDILILTLLPLLFRVQPLTAGISMAISLVVLTVLCSRRA